MEQIDRKPLVVSGQGLLGTWVGCASALTERAAGATFGVVRDLHAESGAVVDATISFADALAQSFTRALRATSKRGHGFGLDVLDAAEQSVLAVVALGRSTGHDATELASRTASSLTVGPRAEPRAVA